jgi:hypothetical protein
MRRSIVLRRRDIYIRPLMWIPYIGCEETRIGQDCNYLRFFFSPKHTLKWCAQARRKRREMDKVRKEIIRERKEGR